MARYGTGFLLGITLRLRVLAEVLTLPAHWGQMSCTAPPLRYLWTVHRQ